MVAPTLVGQWRTQAEIPLPLTTSGENYVRSIMFLLKNGLMGTASGGTEDGATFDASMNWDLEGSSDGVTAGMDAVDRLGGATFNASLWVRNTSGSAHSWYVLSSANTFGLGGTKIYLLVSFQASSASFWTVSYARTPFTGGSITVNPTSTTEIAIGTATVGTQSQCCAENILSTPAFAQITRSPGGEFFFVTNRSSAGFANHFLHLGDFRGVNVGEVFPTYALFHTAVSTRGSGLQSTLWNPGGGFSSRRFTSNARVGTGGPVGYTTQNSSFSGSMPKDVIRNEWPTFPIFVLNYDTGESCVRGFLRDIWWIGAAPVGSGYPFAAPGQQTQVVVGDVLIPSFVPAAW